MVDIYCVNVIHMFQGQKMLSHGRRNCIFAEVLNVERQIKIWLKIWSRWETSFISSVGMILVIVTLATRQTATAMHHCQPSLMFARACVCVHARACQTLFSAGWDCQCSAGDAAAALSSFPDPPTVCEDGRPNYMIHRAPNSPYSPQLTFINYSLLFLETAFWISSWLCCAHCWAGTSYDRLLSIWLNVGTYTCAPFTKWCCGTLSAFYRERWNKYERWGHLQCSNVRTAHTISLKRAKNIQYSCSEMLFWH